jgi:two-component system nitrate/nitrite response regulator NarL
MKVLLIDDHALFRGGVGELLQRRGIEVVAATGDCREGIELALALQPDVVLLDMRMPEMTGLQVLARLREQGFAAAIVMLTTSRDEKDLIGSLQQGASGYLLKDMEPDDLVARLQQTRAGQVVVAPELTHVLARVVQSGEDETEAVAEDRAIAELTPREQEILCHLAAGQSNKSIALNLGISDGTVKLHVKAILRKLGVRSRVEAAVYAVERRFCRADEG